MVYRGIIQGRSDPQMFVSGDLLLYTVNRGMRIWNEENLFKKSSRRGSNLKFKGILKKHKKNHHAEVAAKNRR